MRITLDQITYIRSQTIQITVKNTLTIPVWYAKAVDCGMSFFQLETATGKTIPYSQICDWFIPTHNFTRLNPENAFTGPWNGQILDFPSNQFLPANPDTYRLIVPYSTVEKPAVGQGWENDKRKVYSEQFRIISPNPKDINNFEDLIILATHKDHKAACNQYLKQQFQQRKPKFYPVNKYSFNSQPAIAFDKHFIIKKQNIAKALQSNIWILDSLPYKTQFGSFFTDFEKNQAGDIIDINTEIDHAWQSEAFDSLAHLIESDSYIIILSQNNIYWKMIFDNGQLKTYRTT